MSGRPPITVVTVVYNAEATIARCVESVLAQRIDGLEYLVIDGASTDATRPIVEGFGSGAIRLVSEPDKGLYDAMNKGLGLATGRFIHFLNADDRYIDDDALASLLPHLDPSALCYGQMNYVGEDGFERILGRPFSWFEELRVSRIPQPTMFVAPELYRQVGLFDTSLKVAADYDMVLRLAKRFPVKYIPQPVTTMFSGGLSYRRPDLAFDEARRVSVRHGLGRFTSRAIYLARMMRWRLSGLGRG